MNQDFEPTRLVRAYRQHIRARAEEVFPLLCPEREKDWLPGWDATMLYSVSGVAEPQAVFATPQPGAAPVVWTVVEQRPNERVRFVRWHPDEMVVDLEIDLAPDGARATRVDVRYTYTATTADGARRIARMTEAQWQEQMRRWEDCMNAWLARPAAR